MTYSSTVGQSRGKEALEERLCCIVIRSANVGEQFDGRDGRFFGSLSVVSVDLLDGGVYQDTSEGNKAGCEMLTCANSQSIDNDCLCAIPVQVHSSSLPIDSVIGKLLLSIGALTRRTQRSTWIRTSD